MVTHPTRQQCTHLHFVSKLSAIHTKNLIRTIRIRFFVFILLHPPLQTNSRTPPTRIQSSAVRRYFDTSYANTSSPTCDKVKTPFTYVPMSRTDATKKHSRFLNAAIAKTLSISCLTVLVPVPSLLLPARQSDTLIKRNFFPLFATDMPSFQKRYFFQNMLDFFPVIAYNKSTESKNHFLFPIGLYSYLWGFFFKQGRRGAFNAPRPLSFVFASLYFILSASVYTSVPPLR